MRLRTLYILAALLLGLALYVEHRTTGADDDRCTGRRVHGTVGIARVRLCIEASR